MGARIGLSRLQAQHQVRVMWLNSPVPRTGNALELVNRKYISNSTQNFNHLNWHCRKMSSSTQKCSPQIFLTTTLSSKSTFWHFFFIHVYNYYLFNVVDNSRCVYYHYRCYFAENKIETFYLHEWFKTIKTQNLRASSKLATFLRRKISPSGRHMHTLPYIVDFPISSLHFPPLTEVEIYLYYLPKQFC